MNEKTMVSDALVGVNGELKMFGEMIPQTENKELKQFINISITTSIISIILIHSKIVFFFKKFY